ncbi:MAG: RusA family crossover junction endodeoxyribonuclease [Bacillota bacterium]
MTGVRIILPGIPPTANTYLGNSHHHKIYQTAKKEWENAVVWAVKTAGWRGEPLRKARVELIYHFPDHRRRDPDNYSGKFILDGLKKAGVLVDDSFSNVQLVLTAGNVDKWQPHVEILVSSLEEAV